MSNFREMIHGLSFKGPPHSYLSGSIRFMTAARAGGYLLPAGPNICSIPEVRQGPIHLIWKKHILLLCPIELGLRPEPVHSIYWKENR